MTIFPGSHISLCHGIGREEIEIARIEFETVHPVVFHKFPELSIEPGVAGRTGQIYRCGITVPPQYGIYFSVGFAYQTIPNGTPDLIVVRTDERTHPKHKFEAHFVKLTAHGLGVGKPAGMKIP